MPGGEGHVHHFDAVSGWCAWCNLRDDGRLVAPSGVVWRSGPTYSQQQLDRLREKASA